MIDAPRSETLRLSQSQTAPDSAAGLMARRRPAVLPVVFVMFAGVLFMRVGRVERTEGLSPAAIARDSPVRTTLDPNVAAWHELAHLPNIGPTLARRIVAYRTTAGRDAEGGPGAVFQTPSDLQQVRGIGPRTLARIGGFLHFPE